MKLKKLVSRVVYGMPKVILIVNKLKKNGAFKFVYFE